MSEIGSVRKKENLRTTNEIARHFCTTLQDFTWLLSYYYVPLIFIIYIYIISVAIILK